MDQMVLAAQKWYNETYKGKPGYVAVTEDGITGAGTCKALVRALQIELGASPVDGVIGAGTIRICPIIGPNTENENLVKIIQCGFYCKGYACGGITGKYNVYTVDAATIFRKHVGFTDNDGTMPPKFIKALLNTDAYVKIKGGEDYIREAQMELNRTYINKMPDMWYIPTNGIGDRNMMKAIIAALQYEEAGQTMNGVDGIYGPGTLNKAPLLAVDTPKAAYVKIAKMCMMCMGMGDVGLSGAYNGAFRAKVIEFQEFYCLTYDPEVTRGVIGQITWASLLSSKGHSGRRAGGCDCSERILTDAKASALKEKYNIVGRYLTGTVGANRRDKSLSKEEIAMLVKHNMRIFPIYQDGGASLTYFNASQGEEDAGKAIDAAEKLGVPEETIIYFAVDYDFTEDEIRGHLLEHFKAIDRVFRARGTTYRVGVYGSRNVCRILAENGYTCSSFVSDMSTGFSGNLGFALPKNWAFDQFYEYKETALDGTTFDVDKVAVSGRDQGFGAENFCDGDVTSHDLVLESDGYYKCEICGKRIAHPTVQDEQILDRDDYLQVKALERMYAILGFAEDKYQTITYDFMYKIRNIRTKEKYDWKYDYHDADGKCLFTPPEFGTMDTEIPNNMVQGPETVTDSDVSGLRATLSGILEGTAELLYGIAWPQKAGTELAYSIAEIVKDLQQEGYTTNTLADFLEAIAIRAGQKEFGIIVKLLGFSASMEEELEASELEVGDILVHYVWVSAIPMMTITVVFDKDGNFKTVYIE